MLFPRIIRSPEIDEIHRLYGAISQHCCNVEYILALFLAEPETSQIEDEDKADREFNNLFKIPIGRLIDFFKQHNDSINDEEIGFLKEVNKRRVFLIHHF